MYIRKMVQLDQQTSCKPEKPERLNNNGDITGKTKWLRQAQRNINCKPRDGGS